MATDNDKIVLSFYESLIRKSDIDILLSNNWLNDQIISFYFEYLEKNIYQHDKHILFISPEVTQCIKIIGENEIKLFLEPLNAKSKLFIFFPLNDNTNDTAGGTHWSLLIYSRPKNTFYYLDSLMTINCSVDYNNFIKHIERDLEIGTPDIKVLNCLQQVNGYDCGIHVLCAVDNIARHIKNTGYVEGYEKLTYDIIQNKRRELLGIIQTMGGKF